MPDKPSSTRSGGRRASPRKSAAAAPPTDASAKPAKPSPTPSSPSVPAFSPPPVIQGVRVDASRWLEAQQAFFQSWSKLVDAAAQGTLEPLTDRRFAAPDWNDSPAYRFLAHLYLLNANTLANLAETIDADERAKNKLRFTLSQWADACSPANFLALNPEAQRKLLDSNGASIQQGMQNLLNDLRKGRISQTDETSFEVGRNLAITPGAVVFENALFQLIQYTPATSKVNQQPVLLVPPNINKCYILDLQPHNSFVRHLVERGYTVFLMSWRNPLEPDSRATWADYVEQGVVRALGVTQAISGVPAIHTLGFCVGGTLLSCALSVLRQRGQNPACSLTLLTTLLDFSDAGTLELFIDDAHVTLREQTIGSRGLMTARELAATFAFLRPNDLVWNYVVSNYLKGESPPPFDLLYWNSDSTNLPGPFFCQYLRNLYLENKLIEAGAISIGGTPVDLAQLDMPTYIYASRDDHIVPWRAAYRATQLVPGADCFVLGASGHIAGVINPVSRNRRSYWTNPAMPTEAQVWLDAADEQPGSWWTHWVNWLDARSTGTRAAPTALGSAQFAPIEPAPGRYVQVRAT